MNTHARSAGRKVLSGISILGIAALLLGVSAACGGDSEEPEASPTSPAATSTPAPSGTSQATSPTAATGAPTAAATPPTYVILKTAPDSGYVGTEFTITGANLPANKDADVIWGTYKGSYKLDAGQENVAFVSRNYQPIRTSLGKVKIGADGSLSATFKAPEDYGEVHDIYLTVDGADIAKGGFRIKRLVTISPENGPIGTPITIKATGLGYKSFESIIYLRYDNQPTGLVTAITTKGTALATIRATGKTGKHIIDANHGGRSLPFLNNQQAGTANIPDFRLTFTVTDDKVVPPDSMEWPDDKYLAKPTDVSSLTTATVKDKKLKDASFTPASGPILSKTTLQVSGLEANADVELFWVTARGNRVSPSGWSLAETSLGVNKVDASGKLQATITVPDDLGGWHVVLLVSKGQALGEVPFFVEHSIVGITPRQVKAGEVITINVKGIGWTELDNGVAITYDNAYIGFACGFNSVGDVTVFLVATGEPGVHLVSLYPMIYQGKQAELWGYQQAILTFAQDAPGLQLGYRLPAMHMAFEIVE